jgi:hypothetical protein
LLVVFISTMLVVFIKVVVTLMLSLLVAPSLGCSWLEHPLPLSALAAELARLTVAGLLTGAVGAGVGDGGHSQSYLARKLLPDVKERIAGGDFGGGGAYT